MAIFRIQKSACDFVVDSSFRTVAGFAVIKALRVLRPRYTSNRIRVVVDSTLKGSTNTLTEQSVITLAVVSRNTSRT